MSDNSTLPATGDVIASDDISGVKFQRIKIAVGADGVAVDNDATHPLFVAPATDADVATQTTLAAVLAKIITAPATEAKQDAGNAALATLATSAQLGEVQASPTANTVLDRLKSIATALAGTLTVAAHAVTQSGSWVISTGSAIIGKVGIDQTTPGTTNKVSIGTDGTVIANAGTNLNTSALATLAQIGEVQASPTANTVLDRLKAIATALAGSLTVATHAVTQSGSWIIAAGSAIIGKVGIDQTTPGTTNKVSIGTDGTVALNAAVPAGTSEIGKTNIKHINVVGSTLTRPANTTAYTANDSVSDNATAGTVTANTVTISDVNDDPVDITEILLDSTDTGFAGVSVRLHIFTSDPTASSGVIGGDNAAWSNKKGGWAGSFVGSMVGFSDGSKGSLIPEGAPVRLVHVETGGKRLWWQLQVLGAATPSANSTTFVPRFKGYQGRL